VHRSWPGLLLTDLEGLSDVDGELVTVQVDLRGVVAEPVVPAVPGVPGEAGDVGDVAEEDGVTTDGVTTVGWVPADEDDGALGSPPEVQAAADRTRPTVAIVSPAVRSAPVITHAFRSCGPAGQHRNPTIVLPDWPVCETS